ncbi:MAG TPA: C4-type zinc ribbon domain-containing protein [Nitrospiraceae bacterium]|nr:C4-type zinc ribbon domain-containing protein [Nitrospiraceae bacterium]
MRILEVKDQERKLPALLQASETPFQEARAQTQALAKELETLNKDRRDRERDLEIHEAHVGKLRTRLMELKTNKEYQAHLFEIEMANKKKGLIEEQILTLMERIEQNQQAAKQFEDKAVEAERVLAQEKARVGMMASGFDKELGQLEQKRQQMIEGLDKKLLARYAKLKAARKDVAIVPIRNGICAGCRLQLPPQLLAEVKRSADLQSCSYCHRILYWEGEPAGVSASVSTAEENGQDAL